MKAFIAGLLAALALLAVGLALLFVALPARAQLLLPDGTVNGTCAPTPRVPPLPVPPTVVLPQADMATQATVTAATWIPLPANLPAQIGGGGTKAVIDLNTKGATIGWWVPKVGAVHLYLYAVTWSHLAANPGLAARLVLLAALPSRDSATVAAIGAAYAPTLHILDMCDVWAPLVTPLNASKPAPLPEPPPPPAVSYVVTGTAAYPLTSTGARSITQIPQKPVLGSTCDCVAKEIISTATGARYCAVTIPNVTQLVVAGCSLKRQ
jgi:hypothetical protein